MLSAPETGSSVLFERIGQHIALFALNRPKARNAVDDTIVAGLSEAVRWTEAERDIRAVILCSSTPGIFCAGADLKMIAAGEAERLRNASGGFAGFVFASRAKPWIAAVDGLALAGGFEIALACDMIVASDVSSFALPEVRRGLFAGAGGLMRLPRLLPRMIALELIATGSPLSASRACEFGLVNRLTPPEGARAAAIELAAAICEAAPVAVRESLAIARQSADLSEEALRELVEEGRERLKKTADFVEGPKAFIEKRPPSWTGA